MPRFESIEWGAVVVDGEEFDYDVELTPGGELKPRTSEDKKLGSHTFSKEEFVEMYEDGAEVVVVGTGTSGLAKLSSEAQAFLNEKSIEVVKSSSDKAIEEYNKLSGEGKKVAAIIHITC